MTIEREELAWAAGLFDGEGYVGINITQGKYPVLRVELSQKDRRVLDRFQAAMGGLGTIYLVRRQKGNPYFNWHTGKFESAQAVIAFIWQWLSPVKRKQAKEALLRYRRHYDN